MKTQKGVREAHCAKEFLRNTIAQNAKKDIKTNWRNFYGHLEHHIQYFVDTYNFPAVDILGVVEIVKETLRKKSTLAQRRRVKRNKIKKEKAKQYTFDFTSDD